MTPANRAANIKRRRAQIVTALADWIGRPELPTAALRDVCRTINTSEMQLYRFFATKAQIIDLIIQHADESVTGLVKEIRRRERDPTAVNPRIAAALVEFGKKNPGAARLLTYYALEIYHERHHEQVRAFWAKLPRDPAIDIAAGRLMAYCRSGFRTDPMEGLDAALRPTAEVLW